MYRIEIARGQMKTIVLFKGQARTLDMLESYVFDSVESACQEVNNLTQNELRGIPITFHVKDLGQLNGRKGRC